VEPGQIIYTLLQADADVVALLGERVYPLRAPQKTPYPYATYQVVSGQGNSTMACDLDDDARVQVSLFANTYPQVAQVHAACRKALHDKDVGSVHIAFDTYQESFQDNALCFLRTQDYLLDGLTA
jgi:hypothetical protein